jgi:hypothetical protein
MKKTKWLILSSLVITVAAVVCSCSNVSKNPVKIELPNFSAATVIEGVDGKTDLYKILDGNMTKNTSLNGVSDIAYNLKFPSYIYSIVKANGNSLVNNELNIMSSEKQTTLNNFYSADDLKLSPNGEALAYRAFSSDDINSAEGMKLYDVKNNKQIDLNSNVLISGNVYNWLNSNEVLYYGLIPGVQGSSKIYKYNIETKTEDVYVDKISGYVTYFTSCGDNVLFLQKSGDSSALIYYEKSSGKYIQIDDRIDDIYKTVLNTKTSEIFILGNSKYENKTKLYRFSLKEHSLNSVSYDFPKFIYKDSSIAADENGNLYFCGGDSSDSQNNFDIYMFKNTDDSINLISDHQGNYYLIGSE